MEAIISFISNIYWVGVFGFFVAGLQRYLQETNILSIPYVASFSFYVVLLLLFQSARNSRLILLPLRLNNRVMLPLGLLVIINLLALFIHGSAEIQDFADSFTLLLIPVFVVFSLSVLLGSFLTGELDLMRYSRIGLAVCCAFVYFDAFEILQLSKIEGSRPWISGLMQNRNASAHLISVLLAISLGYNTLPKSIDYLLIIVAGLAVFLCLSRLGIGLYVTVVTIYISSVWRLRQKKLGLSLAFVGIGITFGIILIILNLFETNQASFFPEHMRPRAMGILQFDDQVYSLKGRSENFQAGLERFLQSPILGYGLGFHRVDEPHNELLRQAIDSGIMAPIVFLWFIIAGWKTFNKTGLFVGKVFLLLILIIYPFGQTLSHNSQMFTLYGILCGVSSGRQMKMRTEKLKKKYVDVSTASISRQWR